MQTVDRDTGVPQSFCEIERVHHLGKLALSVRTHPAIGSSEHRIVEIEWILPGGGDIDDPSGSAGLQGGKKPLGQKKPRQVVHGET